MHIKQRLWAIPAGLMLEGGVNAVILSLHRLRQDEEFSVAVGWAAEFTTNFIPSFFSMSFATILWIVADLFSTLNQKIEALLENPNPGILDPLGSPGLQEILSENINAQSLQLKNYRRIHEELCKGVRILSKSYGFQVKLLTDNSRNHFQIYNIKLCFCFIFLAATDFPSNNSEICCRGLCNNFPYL